MKKEEIAQTVQTMIQASSCCEELKNAGRKWLDAIGTAGEHAAAEALLQEIRKDISFHLSWKELRIYMAGCC